MVHLQQMSAENLPEDVLRFCPSWKDTRGLNGPSSVTCVFQGWHNWLCASLLSEAAKEKSLLSGRDDDWLILPLSVLCFSSHAISPSAIRDTAFDLAWLFRMGSGP